MRKQETDVAEESFEEGPCEELESQTGQETDAAIVGCLWVYVMSDMLESNSGWTPESGFACPGWILVLEVARQQRKLPAFADIWNWIMTAEGTDKLPGIESVCREEAAKRQPLVAHTDVGLLGPRIVLPGSADAEDRHAESDNLPAASAGRSAAPATAGAGQIVSPDTDRAPAWGSALAPASEGAPGEEYLVWSSDCEEKS